jgi:abequosyltransferase
VLERLTICIPTFNREAELREALASIEFTLGSTVHVVVSDNASTDGTERMCLELQRKPPFASFVYFRWPSDQGVDRNFLKAVELGTTDYCMLFGSDDAFCANAASLLNEKLPEKPDIALFGRLLCSRDLRKELGTEMFWAEKQAKRYSIRTPEDFASYIRSCTSLAGGFSYISAIVFRRSIWVESDRVRRFVGSFYVHVAALLEGIQNRWPCEIYVDPRPLVKCRTGNDFFTKWGHLRRYTLDWDGYERLAKTYFPDTPGILTELLKHQASLSNLAALSYHLRMSKDVDAMSYVRKRLEESEWSRGASWRWRLVNLIPLIALDLAQMHRRRLRRGARSK